MITPQIAQLESGLGRLAELLPDVPQLEVLLSRLIVFIGRDMSGILDRILRPHGLAETDFRVLMAMFSQSPHGASPGELCAKVAQSAANITRISDHLVELGLITRALSDQDRRRWVLRLTDHGEHLVKRIIPSLFDPIRGAFAGITASERQQLGALLKAVAASVDAIQSDGAGSAA